MTRVAIIGNSHLAAFADAAAQIVARHPKVNLSFFGLDNQVFFKSEALKGTALRVADDPLMNPRQVIDEKAEYQIEFSDFDLVLLTSHGFYLRHLFGALGSFNLLGLGRLNATGPLVSTACLRDAMAAHVKTYTNRLRRFLPPADNVVVVQMPYPSLDAVTIDDTLAGLYAQPDRGILFDMFNTTVTEHMLAKGLALLPVPEVVMDSPFFTKPGFSRAATQAPGQPVALTDLMHMNADYAAMVFDHVHATILTG